MLFPYSFSVYVCYDILLFGDWYTINELFLRLAVSSLIHLSEPVLLLLHHLVGLEHSKHFSIVT